jgi:hypothetical protein
MGALWSAPWRQQHPEWSALDLAGAFSGEEASLGMDEEEGREEEEEGRDEDEEGHDEEAEMMFGMDVEGREEGEEGRDEEEEGMEGEGEEGRDEEEEGRDEEEEGRDEEEEGRDEEEEGRDEEKEEGMEGDGEEEEVVVVADEDDDLPLPAALQAEYDAMDASEWALVRQMELRAERNCLDAISAANAISGYYARPSSARRTHWSGRFY